ncbi:uncharacterized protein LOC124939718 [Impatiens glandulifera]|uniref:uncharacterized protein LOC124939718 n=1 Tax=Impatiens glandulifera TaxID=253017 RepID=UPI001FB0FE79|nr:uncharacterized protein LOC124939718 [Impatiens glandulifera]
MSVELVDSGTIIGFIEDQEAFDNWTNDRFGRMDTNHDGMVSYSELMNELQTLRVLEITDFGLDEVLIISPTHVYESILLQFDHDCNGSVDLEEFKEEMKGMMLAIAHNIGSLPVQMVLEHDSFLNKAVQRQQSLN